MIIGKIDNNVQQISYLKRDNFLIVVDMITRTNFKNLTDGIYEINGRDFYYIIETYETNREVKKPAEVHKKYIDFHYIAYGEESIGYTSYDNAKAVKQEYSEDDDAALYDAVLNESFFVLNKGMYAIFFPCDIHRPGLQYNKKSKVKKVIFKILI